MGRLTDGSDVLVVDTVGFVKDLPHRLVDCFHTTLQEALECDALVMVVDVAHENAKVQRASVLKTLRDLDVPNDLLESRIEVYNKADLIPTHMREHVVSELACWHDRRLQAPSDVVLASALTGDGLDDVIAAITACVARRTGRARRTFVMPISAPEVLSHLYGHRRIHVLETVVSEDGQRMTLTVEADEEACRIFVGQFGHLLKAGRGPCAMSGVHGADD